MLLNGLSEGRDGYPALPNVEAEVAALKGMFETQTLLNEDFRKPALAGALEKQRYPIVHVASHGEFAGSAEDSFLLTWDGKLTLNDLEGLLQPYRYDGQPIELLTLSACRTAAGDERAALGVAGVAVKAGARSALASLWYVNDESSAALIQKFYENLRDKPEAGRAEALRQAQLAIAGQRRYRHPIYWAPFLIIGNWL